MSRLYLTFGFFFISFIFMGQVKLKDLIAFGDKQYEKGDYYYATQIYHQALALDSNSALLQYKMAETQKAYKNYESAAKWYAKVYAEDQNEIYPNALVFYGMMVKQTGDYLHALELFKKAYKEASLYPNEYAYIKSGQEIKSTQFAIQGKVDTLLHIKSMPDSINSYDAEFGHMFKDGIFYFSSLKADSINMAEEVYSKFYHTRIYKSEHDSLVFKQAKQWKELAALEWSTGNGSFDAEGWYYYSICNEKGYNYKCKIVRFKQGEGKLFQIDTLQNDINFPNANATNPFIAQLKNGKEALFFSSDREGGKGGMDIWFAYKNNNGGFNVPKNISAINSIENEVTPWFDSDSSLLYFSSTWHFGYGGYDVFKSETKENLQFTKPLNAGLPLNGPANDLYYFRQGDSLFVSSNRMGSKFLKNPTCCSDIYFAHVPIIPPKIPPTIPMDTIPKDSVFFKFPVLVFFRNDYPKPKSWSKESDSAYNYLYENYKQAFPSYLDSTLDKASLEDFFKTKVDFGYQELLKLYDSIIQEVDKGKTISLYIRGFASPLNYTKYNVNLTQRRISSIYKFFLTFQNGRLTQALKSNPNIGFSIIEIPLGEYSANQLTSDSLKDKAASVYSLDASIERKVEILYFSTADWSGANKIKVSPMVQNEEINGGQISNKKITIEKLNSKFEIAKILDKSGMELDYEVANINDTQKEISLVFKPVFNGKHTYEYADIYFEGVSDPIRVYFTFLQKELIKN